jgi:hypothetical protein
MKNNFKIKVTLISQPWPFSWGPWHRSRTVILRGNEIHMKIWQRAVGESGQISANPVEVQCYSGASEATTTCDFKSGSRLKRRTKI